MKIIKTIIVITVFGLISITSFAQTSAVKVESNSIQKLTNSVNKNEVDAKIKLREAKVAYQNLMNDNKNGKIVGKKFDKKKAAIENAMEKAKIALLKIDKAKNIIRENY